MLSEEIIFFARMRHTSFIFVLLQPLSFDPHNDRITRSQCRNSEVSYSGSSSLPSLSLNKHKRRTIEPDSLIIYHTYFSANNYLLNVPITCERINDNNLRLKKLCKRLSQKLFAVKSFIRRSARSRVTICSILESLFQTFMWDCLTIDDYRCVIARPSGFTRTDFSILHVKSFPFESRYRLLM